MQTLSGSKVSQYFISGQRFFFVTQPMLSLRLCQVNDNPIPDFRPLEKATLIEYETFEMILEFCITYFIYWSQRHGVREVESYRRDILQNGTVECRYSTVKHNMILHVIRQWPRKNMHPRSCSQQTSLSHPRGWAIECFCEDLDENWPQIMACRLFDAKPLSKPVLGFCQLDS